MFALLSFLSSMLSLGIQEVVIIGLILGFVLVPLAFAIWMLVDCIQYETSDGNTKTIWLLVIILSQWVGALVYFFVRRMPRLKLQGR